MRAEATFDAEHQVATSQGRTRLFLYCLGRDMPYTRPYSKSRGPHPHFVSWAPHLLAGENVPKWKWQLFFAIS